MVLWFYYSFTYYRLDAFLAVAYSQCGLKIVVEAVVVAVVVFVGIGFADVVAVVVDVVVVVVAVAADVV